MPQYCGIRVLLHNAKAAWLLLAFSTIGQRDGALTGSMRNALCHL